VTATDADTPLALAPTSIGGTRPVAILPTAQAAAARPWDRFVIAGSRESEGSMVRKHYRITRLRMTRKRPKTPAPTDGWLLADLAKLEGSSLGRYKIDLAKTP